MNYFFFKELLILPNLITISRLIVSIPFFFILYYRERFGLHWVLIPAFFMVSTDLFDGYIARKTGKITFTGKILDAVFDKIIVDTAGLILIIRKEIPLAIFAPLLLRDIILAFLGLAILYYGVKNFGTNIYGRLTPLSWTIGMILVVIGIKRFALKCLIFGDLLAIFSGYIYINKGIKTIRERGKI